MDWNDRDLHLAGKNLHLVAIVAGRADERHAAVRHEWILDLARQVATKVGVEPPTDISFGAPSDL